MITINPLGMAVFEARGASLMSSSPRMHAWGLGTLLSISVLLFAVFVWVSVSVLRTEGEGLLLVFISVGLFYCALVHQILRFGAARRAMVSQPLKPEAWSDGKAPSVTVLIPSYREDRRVIVGTVLSAALMRYPNQRIVVLVDDPPDDRAAIQTSLDAVADVERVLQAPKAICRRVLTTAVLDRLPLAEAYQDLGQWVSGLADQLMRERCADFLHVDNFLIAQIVKPLRGILDAEAARVLNAPLLDMAIERDRLAHWFSADISTFQRKSYVNLSHEPNKAMNLNAYLSLLGGRFSQSVSDAGLKRLDPVTGGAPADLIVPASDYVMTLDADSLVMPEYLLTLVELLQQHPRSAIAQSPYRAFPGSTVPLERIAGATTDVQSLLHQGAGAFHAAYWVGANAVLRVSALQEIRQVRQERGFQVPVYIQDKTLIEDTGATVDLLKADWHVHNHMDQLAFSATPTDFGALTIQRKRWATGGLIVLMDLLGLMVRRRLSVGGLFECVLRAHYLIAPTIGNIAILVLMTASVQLDERLLWVPAFMLPYFIGYALDLKHLGYRWRDLFGVCSLNLMLLPVNLAGIAATVWQMITGRRGAFLRTPKSSLRLSAPLYVIGFNVWVLVIMLYAILQALATRDHAGLLFPLINGCFYLYGLYRLMGLGDWMQRLIRVAHRSMVRPVLRIFGHRPRDHRPLSVQRGLNVNHLQQLHGNEG